MEGMTETKFGTRGSLGGEDDARTLNTRIAHARRESTQYHTRR